MFRGVANSIWFLLALLVKRKSRRTMLTAVAGLLLVLFC